MKFGELEQHKSLRERIASLLRNAIFSGTLKPGDRVVETQLAKDMRVGQASIREALQDLEHEGLITRISNRGCRVTNLSVEDITQMYDLRTELEVMAVARVPPGRLFSLRASLEAALARMEVAEHNADIGEYSKADYDFHQAIWRSSGNEFLVKALNVVTIPLWAFSVIYFHRHCIDKGVDPADRELHRQLLETAVANTSIEEKQVATRKILDAFRNMALEYFRPEQDCDRNRKVSVSSALTEAALNGP